MGGRTGGSSSQTSTTVLPGNQQTNVDTLLQGALNQYNTGGPRYFGGNTVAGFTPAQQQAQQGAMSYAQGPGQTMVNQAVGANNYWLDPNRMTNFSSIPGYGAMREGIIRGATQNLTDNTLPIIRDDAILNGQYGGTSQQIGEALATARTNEGIANQLGNLDLGLYNTNVSANQNAIARSPQMFDLGLAPSNVFAGVGQQQQQMQQQQIDADVSRWNFEQLRPLLNLQSLQGLTGNAGQYGGTTTSTGQQAATDGGSGLMQGIGTLIMLASLL